MEENFKRRRVWGNGLLGYRPRLRVVAVIAGFALVALGWAFFTTAENRTFGREAPDGRWLFACLLLFAGVLLLYLFASSMDVPYEGEGGVWGNCLAGLVVLPVYGAMLISGLTAVGLFVYSAAWYFVLLWHSLFG